MTVAANFTDTICRLATTRVRLLLAELIDDPDYADKATEGNFSFLRTDRAFDKCMELAHRKWRWVHKKLG
jgi:hypothetical protein